MTVAELIEKLKELPQNAHVVVTDSSCCGCGYGHISDILLQDHGVVFIDGDKYAKQSPPQGERDK